MNTYSMLLSVACVFLATLTSLATAPNVVIIVTDDQGWGDVGYHTPAGQVPIQTPHMNSFATSGIRLERFYATAVCSVTRSALLTGRNTIRTGTNNTRGVPLGEHLMSQTFKTAGYQTFLCGKWHLGGSDKNLSYTTVNGRQVRIIQEGQEYAPYNRGWDSHYGQYSGAIDYFTHRSAEAENPDMPDWWLNGVQQDGAGEHTDSQGHGGWSPDLLADKAISHIQNRDPSKPMLLYLAFNSIHGPVSAPPALITKYQNLGVTDANRRLIAAAVDGMDAAMGRVLAALSAAGISNNTIVVWFGDNGGDEVKGSLNDPLRGTKGDGYDGALRTPAGIRWPGVLPAGVTSNQHVWVGDLFPTLCAATGVIPQNTKPFDGINLWSALLAASNTTTVQRPVPLVTGTATPVSLSTFTDPVNGGSKIFKLIRNRVGTSFVNELFNMADDQFETVDLLLGGNAAAYSGIVASLTTAITDIALENAPPYIGPPLITNSVPPGGTVTLYAPFTSYKTPSVQWRKNGVPVSGATTFAQVTDTLGDLVSGAYTTRLTLSGVSPADAAAYDVVVTNVAGSTTSASGTLVISAAGPSIASIATGPSVPTYLDDVWVTANVQPGAGQSLQTVQLTYNNGAAQTTTVFSETMRTAAITPWIGDGCDNPWTISAASANNVRQTTGANNSASGNPCGLEFNKGTPTLTDSMAATTNPINTAGAASGYVEFYVETVDLVSTNGWTFQVSTDGGTTYATKLSELTGTNHPHQRYQYNLSGADFTANLKLRFQMTGYNAVNPTPPPKVRVDDIKVITTSPGGPVTVTMFDDGMHGDGAAGDGAFGALVPRQASGANVTYSISATDSGGTNAGSAPATYPVSYTLEDAIFRSSEFLGVPTRKSVTLNMETAIAQEVFVEIGDAAGHYTMQTPPVTTVPGAPFEIIIQSPNAASPLDPNTLYHYRVRHRTPGETVFKTRGDRTFRTQRTKGESFVFTITADPHLDDITSPDLFELTMDNLRADNADFHVDLGDIFMTDKLTQFIPGITVTAQTIIGRATNLRTFFGRNCHSSPFFYVLGNHESEYGYTYNADTTPDKSNNFASWNHRARTLYYPTPVPDLSPTPDKFYTGNPATKLIFGQQQMIRDYYAWEWGDALFVVLDPYWNTLSNPNSAPGDNWRWSLGPAQYNWLKTTLETSSSRFKFVFLHNLVGGVASGRGGVETAHRYEWGGKNADGLTDGFATQRPGWAMPIHQLLVANRVSAVFHGHDHFYAYQQLDGIVYQECPQPGTPNFSTGSAADGQYTTGTILPNSGHLRVSVSRAETKVEYVRAATAALETAALHNRDIAHTYTMKPSAFIELTATRSGADAVVRWDALRGQSYTVQYSNDLVNWTSVAVGQTNTWTDVGVFNGPNPTKKFYRVTK